MNPLPIRARGDSACRQPCPPRVLTGLLLLCALGLAAPARAAPMLTLTPHDGALYGTPGAIVGWGFTLTNDANYLVVTAAEFPASLTIGAFVDYIGAQFIVVGPAPESETVSQAFDPGLLTGLGAFAIDAFAPLGGIAAGLLTVTYDLFTQSPNDPSFDPDQDTLSLGNVLSADASVQVVPAPAPLLLLGLLGLLWRERRASRTGNPPPGKGVGRRGRAAHHP